MNEVDRQILSFMRDVENPAQRNFSVGVIDDNVEKNVRKRHLDLLEGRGLVNKSVPDGDSGIENTTYWLSAEGMQAITTSDLDQTLHETNERISQLNSELNETLSTTDERLTETTEDSLESAFDALQARTVVKYRPREVYVHRNEPRTTTKTPEV